MGGVVSGEPEYTHNVVIQDYCNTEIIEGREKVHRGENNMFYRELHGFVTFNSAIYLTYQDFTRDLCRVGGYDCDHGMKIEIRYMKEPQNQYSKLYPVNHYTELGPIVCNENFTFICSFKPEQAEESENKSRKSRHGESRAKSTEWSYSDDGWPKSGHRSKHHNHAKKPAPSGKKREIPPKTSPVPIKKKDVLNQSA